MNARATVMAMMVTAGCSADPLAIGTPDFAGYDGARAPHCDAGCADEDLALDDGDMTTRERDLAGAPDLARQDAAITQAVAHTRELRAMWVASVLRLDFPSKLNLTAAEARAEISSIVDVSADHGLNAIFFQARPESDAFYSSSLEPWSRWLTGTQGGDPGWDPLALFVELAHKKGIEVHAWVNPYRALSTAGSQTTSLHVTQRFPSAAITYNAAVTMNPADTTVRAWVVSVVADIAHRYDIDGVVFDDYFYPYPTATPYPDDASYQAYTDGGGMMSKSDWRRDNVNQLVAGVAAALRADKPWMRFGVAPFGIYRPGMPAGVTGLDAYEAISCDSLKWMNESWVDYLAPQLYWTSTSSGQPFGALIDWWAAQSKPLRPVLASIALYKLGTAPEWTTAEIETQVMLTRGESGAAGQTWFRNDYLRDDTLGVSSSFAKFYAAPARPPIVPQMAAATLAAPTLDLTGSTVSLSHAAPSTVRGYAVYRDGVTFERWVPAGTSSVALSAGRYAISAIGRGGEESLGVTVTMP